ncbi:MAG: MMPL family transporter [Bacilli bacterium]|nr:MMPL family transporter [Bacilli bacterium]
MKKISKFITNNSKLIVIISILLLVPALIGYIHTKINYDILVYLPKNIETIKGQNILTDDFKTGAFSFIFIEDKKATNTLELESKIKKIDGVNKVFSIYDITDTTIPLDIIPDEIKDKMIKKDSSLMLVTFYGSTSDEGTINAVRELRKVTKNNDLVSGMTAMVVDTMELSDQEIMAYVCIAVILCLIVLVFATDSYMVPIFLLGNIGMAILYNLGSNVMFGQISYITKAITAVLQLGVTTDFSIFLYHKYEERKNDCKDKKVAMEKAINDTFKSVIGSSLTTIAGFLALCTMNLTLGKDIGLVMAKGVFFGLVCVLIIFPSLLLLFDKSIEKTKHKNFMPKFDKLIDVIIKRRNVVLIIFLILLLPAIYGNKNVEVYYKLDKSLPSNLGSSVANSRLRDEYNIVSPEIVLLNKSVKKEKVDELIAELKDIKGIDLVLSPSTLTNLPTSIMPDELESIMSSDKYQLIIVNSIYEIASPELNNQVGIVNNIVKKYDKNAILAGEGPLMKDLTVIADHDFKMVNYASILVIFILMLIVLKSIGLPIILIITIEFAIFVNMAVAYYTGTTLPFIASIVVGTIQLGATIDYAILMSTSYLKERTKEKNKEIAMKNTLYSSVPSIFISALCFFGATFGVSVYSKIDMIGAICTLLSRGAIISMLVVIFILPALLLLFDKLIMKTTKNMKEVL